MKSWFGENDFNFFVLLYDDECAKAFIEIFMVQWFSAFNDESSLSQSVKKRVCKEHWNI